jgi:hypothetical protein
MTECFIVKLDRRVDPTYLEVRCCHRVDHGFGRPLLLTVWLIGKRSQKKRKKGKNQSTLSSDIDSQSLHIQATRMSWFNNVRHCFVQQFIDLYRKLMFYWNHWRQFQPHINHPRQQSLMLVFVFFRTNQNIQLIT